MIAAASLCSLTSAYLYLLTCSGTCLWPYKFRENGHLVTQMNAVVKTGLKGEKGN